jgi:hypothetical protein
MNRWVDRFERWWWEVGSIGTGTDERTDPVEVRRGITNYELENRRPKQVYVWCREILRKKNMTDKLLTRQYYAYAYVYACAVARPWSRAT